MLGLFGTAKKELLTQEPIQIFSDNHLSLYNVDKNALILDGYDPVALSRSRNIEKGIPELSVTHKGLLFYFSSKANMRRFNRDKERYIPQYGGWCTYHMSLGFRRKIDIQFSTVNEKNLYNFSGLIPQLQFLDNKEALLERAEIAWKLFQQQRKNENQSKFDSSMEPEFDGNDNDQ